MDDFHGVARREDQAVETRAIADDLAIVLDDDGFRAHGQLPQQVADRAPGRQAKERRMVGAIRYNIEAMQWEMTSDDMDLAVSALAGKAASR